MEFTVRTDVLLIILVVSFVLFGHTLLGSADISPYDASGIASNAARVGIEAFTGHSGKVSHKKEGFTNNSSSFSPNSQFGLANRKPVSTKSWFSPDLTYKKGGKKGRGVQQIMNRKPQQIPLPDDQLSMFANTDFKPECCPNTYSNSEGCACMTDGQYNYLINRGGNNVPYSEY